MDPFGLKGHVPSTAISIKQTLAPDIYESLFDKIFFESPEFSHWSKGNQPWQLHCYGAPGCGKVGGKILIILNIWVLTMPPDYACYHRSSETSSDQWREGEDQGRVHIHRTKCVLEQCDICGGLPSQHLSPAWEHQPRNSKPL